MSAGASENRAREKRHTEISIDAHEKMVVLGPEHDQRLHAVLKDVLGQGGGAALGRDWGVAGSQELETVEVEVDGQRLLIQAETYVGLSIAGPSELVDKVQRMVEERMRRGAAGNRS